MGSAVKKITKPLNYIFPGIDEAANVISPDAPKLPGMPKTETAPDPDAKATADAEARRRQRVKGTGRTSTVLTPGNNLG